MNNTGVFTVSNTSRVFISGNGLVLNFATVQLFDQEYYACAFFDATNTLRPIQAYFVYVRVFPLLSIVVGNAIINQSDIISFDAPGTYQLACLAVGSRPSVILELIDTFTFESLGNPSNSRNTTQCDQNGLCNVIYQVEFTFEAGSRFLFMTSLTCTARSSQPDIDLDSSISRSVRVFFQNQPIVPNPFINATSLIATALVNYTIVCNTDVTNPITWIRTANKTGQFFVPFDSRVTSSNNGRNLNFANVQLIDEEYYACAFQNTPTTFRVLAGFYLYVKGLFFVFFLIYRSFTCLEINITKINL